MGLKLNATNGGGSVELDVPDTVNSDLALTVPATAGEVLVKDSNDRVLLNATASRQVGSATAAFQIEGTTQSSSALSIVRNENNTGGAQLTLGKSRGTDVNSNTACADGDTLGRISWAMADGDDVVSRGAHIYSEVDFTSGTDDSPCNLTIGTTADGDNAPTDHWRMDYRGQIIRWCSDAPSTHYIFSSGDSAGTSKTIQVRHSGTSIDSIGTECFIVRANGDVLNTNNSYSSISDIKLKENIVDAGSQWEDIKGLRVRKYNFKEETGHQTHTQIGLIAQEVESVSPGLVLETPDLDDNDVDLGTTTKQIHYSVLYMKAVKALQEAITRIETLEAKVTALEAAE